jgi:F-type H+-transporting ATPase subunit delta
LENVKAGRRYATALFRLSLDQGSAERVHQDLCFLVKLLDDAPAFERYLTSPALPAQRKKEALARELAPHIAEISLSFLQFLIDKRRSGVLRAVLERYSELLDEQQGLIRAKVTTAVPLGVDQREALIAKLRVLTGGRIELEEQVDASILGGAILTYDDRMIDGSVRSQLALMRERMKKVRVA